ncbi:MAG: MORN repeat-containing protein, partial [bacterium]
MNYLNQTVLFLVFFLLFGCAAKTPQYKGEMKDGNKHGTGTLTYPDGSEYI